MRIAQNIHDTHFGRMKYRKNKVSECYATNSLELEHALANPISIHAVIPDSSRSNRSIAVTYYRDRRKNKHSEERVRKRISIRKHKHAFVCLIQCHLVQSFWLELNFMDSTFPLCACAIGSGSVEAPCRHGKLACIGPRRSNGIASIARQL